MQDDLQVVDNPIQTNDEQESSIDSRRPYVLSLISLIAGLIALGMAVIPPFVWDRPIQLPFTTPAPPPEPKTQHEGGLTLKIKSMTLTLGGKEVPVEEKPKPVTITRDPVKWFTISAIGVAILSMFISTLAQKFEKHTVLTTSAVSLSVAAITWQYIIIGIVIGAAIAILLVILSALGGLTS